jgi:AcrR family transcriptional regulator
MANFVSVSETSRARKGSRPYRSPRRDEQARRTRERIITAAATQFVAAGYTACTMRAIATAAGVAVPTIELAFGTKAQLLKAVIDVAIAGDDRPIPVLDREWARTAEQTTSVRDFLAIVGRVLRDAQERVANLLTVAYEAAVIDPDIAALTRQMDSQRAATVAWIVDGIMHRTELRAGGSRAAAIDTIWLLMDPVVYRRLTVDRGWSPRDYEKWFTDSIPRLLLP